MKFGYVRKIPKCPVEGQHAALDGHVPARHVYEYGRGLETLDAIVLAGRDRKDAEILIAADLRVFGESRKAILKEVDRLTEAGLVIKDVAHPEDKTLAKMLDRALAALGAHKRFEGSKKSAARTGRSGGVARGVKAKERRHGNIDEDTARKIWTHPKLTVEEKLWIMGPQWTKATAHRQFGKSRG